MFSPNTDNAIMKPLYLHVLVQIRRKSLLKKNKTHPTSVAWCQQPVCWKPSSLHECIIRPVWTQEVCQWAAAVPVSVRHNKLSVLTGSGWAGWVASDAPHHLPSCRHPIQGILGSVNRGAHHGAHGRGLTGRASERAAVSLQDACALPVVHVVSCRGIEGFKCSGCL